jgi:hypothetical protein
LWFHCVTAAERGGETILADARSVHDRIVLPVRHAFAERGVRYVSSYRGERGLLARLDRRQRLERSWMDTFETADRSVAEQRCRDLGMSWRWLPSGRLVTEARRPAIARHPSTGETVWFNQAHIFRMNRRYIGRIRLRLARWLLSADGAPGRDATYGDGGPIDDDTLDHLFDVMEATTATPSWRRGDVLWLDNLLCMHGRNPFHGPRKVLVAMTR